MIKIIPPGSWSFDGPQLEEVKVASTGLRGRDFAEFVKRANHPLALWVREHPPGPGEVYVHNVAMGSTEKFGFNRNHDGYSDAMLRVDTPTFEKHARWFYSHKNDDPSKSYGDVRRATYDPDVGRVETIAALYATKEAALRKGGLVAKKTLDKLASNRDVAVSQSCRVPKDRCVGCGHEAKNRSEYCGPERCKYGGCRDHLGRVFDDGFVLGVDNPRCTFFDLSDVSDTRGADRTAFVTGKVAAARLVGGAELAERLGLVAPDYLLDRGTLSAVGCLRKLAAYRYPVLAAAPSWDDCVEVRAKIANRPAEFPTPADEYDRHALAAELAHAGVVLPPARWLSLMTGVAADKCAAAFAGGLDVARDFLSRQDSHELLSDVPVRAPDTRLSALAWMAPTDKAHAIESARGVLAGSKAAHAGRGMPEAKARYLAYQGRVLALAEGTGHYDRLLMECARHNLCVTA